MSELVDRVAKAIFDGMDIADGLDGTVAERYARAAVKAMREPTEVMVEIGMHEFQDPCRNDDVRKGFGKMIDAALK